MKTAPPTMHLSEFNVGMLPSDWQDPHRRGAEAQLIRLCKGAGRAIAALTAVALTACGPVGVAPQGTPEDLFGTVAGGGPSLNYLYDESFALSTAGHLAEHCEALVFSQIEEEKVLIDVRQRILDDGITPNQMDAIFRSLEGNEAFQQRLKADETAYRNRWRLDETDPDTFCRAGRAEIAAESKVARFLKIQEEPAA